jgi:hypothetical protein
MSYPDTIVQLITILLQAVLDKLYQIIVAKLKFNLFNNINDNNNDTAPHILTKILT